ncbi:MAG TPA: sulfite exporter TauE/SafE family protein [Candidatus Omnitrophota bacterium]|nr:sulfite exporter TauE/SafE family protein [Candidatus Omnitrophota bacterium]
MEYFVVCLTALVASGLTFFSGFGLGTILMPVLAIFFPVPIAVGATAVVHLANNLFKLFLIGRSANKSIVVRFGIPAVFAALLGAFLLTYVSSVPVVASYRFSGHVHEVTIVKLVIGLLIVFFSCLEFIPAFAKISIDQKYMAIGGMVSGFFGGLSGNQGAFRSMFLIKAGLKKEEFIGTNVVLAVMVDFGRLIVYGIGLYSVYSTIVTDLGGLVLAATISAFIGAFLGKMILKTVTLRAMKIAVGTMLILLGIALSMGFI